MRTYFSPSRNRCIFLLILFCFALLLQSCATIPEAIENRELYVGAKMSESIFLNPIKKAQLKTIYIDVSNTSQLTKFDPDALKERLKNYLSQKGYNIVSNPENAGYILQVNVRYFDLYKKSAAKEGAATGAVASGATALALTDSDKALIGAAIAAGMGYVGGAVVGSLIKIKTFAGVVDLQIMEKTENPVQVEVQTKAKQGTSTTIRTETRHTSNYQIYRNSIAVTATKTNLSEEEAIPAIIDKLAYQIAQIF